MHKFDGLSEIACNFGRTSVPVFLKKKYLKKTPLFFLLTNISNYIYNINPKKEKTYHSQKM